MSYEQYYGNHVDAVDDSELFDRTEDTKSDLQSCAYCKDEVNEDETVLDKDSHDRYCFDCMRKGRFITHLQGLWDGTNLELEMKIEELNLIYHKATKK